MSKGKEKVIEIDDDELDFLVDLLMKPIFDPRILLETVGHSSVTSSVGRMSPEIFTSSDKSSENESSSSEETLSEHPD